MQTHLCIYILSVAALAPIIRTKLSSCDRELIAHKTYNIDCMTLSRKSLSAPGLVRETQPFLVKCDSWLWVVTVVRGAAGWLPPRGFTVIGGPVLNLTGPETGLCKFPWHDNRVCDGLPDSRI